MRNITIYSTIGQNKKLIFTDAINYGDLKVELIEHGFKVDDMKAIVGETKVSLEVDGSVLPITDFKLFLMPVKTKSGASRADIYLEISSIIESDGEKAKDFFNNGQNYTRKKSTELSELIEEYKLTVDSDDTEDKIEANFRNVENKVESVVVNREDLNTIITELSNIDFDDMEDVNSDKIDDIIMNIEKILENPSAINLMNSVNNSENFVKDPLTVEAEELAKEFDM